MTCKLREAERYFVVFYCNKFLKKLTFNFINNNIVSEHNFQVKTRFGGTTYIYKKKGKDDVFVFKEGA